MLRLPKIINRNLSVKLSLIVVSSMAILLMASLVVILHYSRKALKQETLQKASQTLESTVQHIDNILLSVEQTSGNIYYTLLPHLQNPDTLYTFARQLVASNPYVTGCAIAMKPYYYPDRELFMAYYHRNDNDGIGDKDAPLIQSDSFGDRPYTQQVWYTEPMETGKAKWRNPLVGMSSPISPLVTFSLPIPDKDGKPIGVLGVDISLSLLSKIVADAKPSANSYCTLLDSDGSFIVYPGALRFGRKTALALTENKKYLSAREAVNAMMSGKTDYKPLQLDGKGYYIFYKPFSRTVVPGRTMEKLGWSAGIIFPEDDIFGDYKSLFYYVVGIAVIGLLLIYLLSSLIIHRHLKPLGILTSSAQHIAEGNYNEPIPDSKHRDEIGRLQDNFQEMQRVLSDHIGELEQLTATLQEHGEQLRDAYNRAKQADRLKIAFLHNMTNQMTGPALSIHEDVTALCDGAKERREVVDDILKNGNTITDLLNNLLNMSDEELRKEGAHE